MEHKKMTTGDIVIETVTALAFLLFLCLQVCYKVLYQSSWGMIAYHVLPMVLIYTGMLLLQRFPEILNGYGSEPLKGMVRRYAVKMVQNCKLLLVVGLLVPSLGDVLGGVIDPAYSLFLMAGILVNIAWYLYRIYRYNSSEDKKDS